jgi:3-hydroxyisobutyrate dehydrogenase-like beta-hydroxyacid dehydrogenase
MGHVVGQVLKENGMRVITCLEGRSQRTRHLAKQAEIEDTPSYAQLVQEADMLLSILVPARVEEAAERVARALEETGEELVYVDCNAVAPATARRVCERIEAVGSRMVDAGIIGGPPRRAGSTRFYASGPHAGEFVGLREFGLDVRRVGDQVGQASGFKMTYAALTKGTAALATELLIAARRMGLYDALTAEFQMSQGPRYAGMEGMLPGMPTKARRWVGEMEEIAQTFADLGMTPNIYQGAADMYRLVSETPLADETPENRDAGRTLAQTIEMLAAHLEGKHTD